MNGIKNKTCLYTVLLCLMFLALITIIVLVAFVVIAVDNKKNTSGTSESTSRLPTISTTATKITSTIRDRTTTFGQEKSLVETININQLMLYLKELQSIADKNNRTRSLGTPGFKSTLDFIEANLILHTDFQIFREQFSVPIKLTITPILTSTIQGIDKNYTYDKDFREAFFSQPVNFLKSVRLTIVPNYGCDDGDWQYAAPYSANNSVVLIMYNKNNCSMMTISVIAQKYNISGLLVYDSDSNSTNLPFVAVSQSLTIPVMTLSYKLGMELIEATQNHLTTNPTVRMFIPLENIITVPIPTENLCADTLTGNKQQTIVIGSHSDSVENSSGINDNGKTFFFSYN